MERWIERGPDDGGDQEPPPSMSPPPLVKTESSQAMVHPHPPSSSAGDGDRQSVKYADRSQREGTLCVLQGLLLFAFYGLFSEEKEKHKKGRVLLARAVEVWVIVYHSMGCEADRIGRSRGTMSTLILPLDTSPRSFRLISSGRYSLIESPGRGIVFYREPFEY